MSNLANTLRMYAEDMHSATGYNERSSAMSKAADMIEKFENMSASEACATIPSVMEYVKQLEQDSDELKDALAVMSRKTIDICNELLAVNARLKSERNEAELREYRVLGRAGAAEESFKQQHRINVELIEQLEAADNALRSVEAALKGVPYKGIYANGVEWLKARVAFLETVTAPDSLLDVGAICDQRDQLAAQNVALKDRVENQIHAIEKGNLASEAMECRLTEQLAALALQNVALRSALTQFLDQEDNPPEDTGEWREVLRVLSFCKGV